jgi:uncharacterized protein (TIGR00299 family) protein
MNMSKKLYIECESGISGDMAVAALLDLGADANKLQETLTSFHIDEEFDMKISSVMKSGLKATDFDVILPEENDNHDYDMNYLYGHLSHEDGHEDSNIASHEHESAHQHENHGHHHGRGPVEIGNIFQNSNMTDGAKEVAMTILDIIADAEATVHGVPRDEVHFHEVGAVDSIVDIASFAICYDDICHRYDIEDTIVSPLSEGHGTVRCQHGILPVPVPAVTEIVRKHGIIFHKINVEGELVTPTGAAIVAAVGNKGSLPEKFIIHKTGLGAGKREYNTPGFVRMMILEER